MHTPETAEGGEATHPPATIPVEKLVESMQPDKPLEIDGSYGNKSGGGGSGSGSSSPQ